MDLTTIVVHIGETISEFQSLAGSIALLVGLWYIAQAITKSMKASSTPGGGSAEISGAAIFTSLIVGALLLDLSGTMGGVFESMTGEQGRGFGLVSYSGGASIGAFQPVLNAIMTIISTFGWWYGFKGFTMFKKASEGHGTGGYEDYAWKGLIHALGGAAMVNISNTLDAFKETAGLTF